MRNRAAETDPGPGVYRRDGDQTGSTAGFVFGPGLIRTAVCTEKVGFIRTKKMAEPMPPKIVRKGEKPAWQTTRT
jgi:hypothetical protein